MEYKGKIAIDMTGGDVFQGKTVLERTTKWAKKAITEFPNYFFYTFGPKNKMYTILPHNFNHIYPDAGQTSLDKIMETIDVLKINAIVTHAPAREIQTSIIGKDPAQRRIKTVAGLRRPALIAIIPTAQKNKYALALDVGANYWNKTIELEQYAHLGTIVSKNLFGTTEPTVAIDNMCEESNFGPLEYRELYKKLEKEKNINFTGFVESRHLMRLAIHKHNGKDNFPDVVLFEGYMGNKFIKTMEDTVKLMLAVGKQEFFQEDPLLLSAIFDYARAGVNLAINLFPFQRIRKRLQPKRYGGALLGGVRTAENRDIVFIKGHGEADEGIYYGIKRAINYHNQNAAAIINAELEERLLNTDTKE